jgi:hypothetical protein
MALPVLALLPAVISGFGAIKDLVIKFWPSAEDKAKVDKIRAEIKVIEDEVIDKTREHEERLQQLQINLEEAKSEKFWKSGWRPGLGWVCAVGWFIDIICVSIYNFFAPIAKLGIPTDKLEILMWMTAGLAGIRMIDKGVSKFTK